MTYDVVIIGGGLAGCAAAIHLGRQGRRVLLLEKKHYPAHKLCGEFLSTEVMVAFDRLGVLPAIEAAGAHSIRRAYITTAGGVSFESALPGTALGLSRYTLDRLLFEQAQAAGAEAYDGALVAQVEGSLKDGFEVQAGGTTYEARLVLGAYGKRSRLDGTLQRAFLKEQSPRVAFKAHYEGLDLGDMVELHAFPGGYCGLSHIEGGRVNVCWIAEAEALQAAGGTPEAMIEQVLCRNPALKARFGALRRVTDRFEAVSQITFAYKGTFENGVCMVGDTAAMIAPLCGDGMAMALRAAELVAPLAAPFLDGELTAKSFEQTYRQAWEKEFKMRLRLGRWIHAAYSRPPLAAVGVQACRMVPPLGRWLIRKTRG